MPSLVYKVPLGALSMLVLLGAGRSVSGREFPFSHFFLHCLTLLDKQTKLFDGESMKGDSVPFVPVPMCRVMSLADGCQGITLEGNGGLKTGPSKRSVRLLGVRQSFSHATFVWGSGA